MKDCIFCKIIEGTIPTTKIYEDDRVLAFKDISPLAPIHYLFIPKKHTASLCDVSPSEMDTVKELYAAVMDVVRKEGLDKRGFRTVINTGEMGGQAVPHVHLHLLGGKQLSASFA